MRNAKTHTQTPVTRNWSNSFTSGDIKKPHTPKWKYGIKAKSTLPDFYSTKFKQHKPTMDYEKDNECAKSNIWTLHPFAFLVRVLSRFIILPSWTLQPHLWIVFVS